MAISLNYRLRGSLLSAFANRFEMRREPKQLMQFYYKISHCCTTDFLAILQKSLFRAAFSHAISCLIGKLTEWKSALPGESEIYFFDAPGTPKFL